MMKIYLCTRTGVGKAGSDDRVLVGKAVYNDCEEFATVDSGSVAVADGVGGNQAGDIAAMLACTELARMEKPTALAFQEVNARLLELSQSSDRLKGMGTTLSGIWLEKENMPPKAVQGESSSEVEREGRLSCLVHVGNTRIYAIHAGNYLRQLTTDDTVVEYLLRSGKLSEEEALSYAGRNEITACLGGGRPELNKLRVESLPEGEERLLLTSDGVHEILSLDEMEDIIAKESDNLLEAVKLLVKNAQENGSNDDCTAVIIEISAKA